MNRLPTALVYTLMVVVGAAAFLYPFWFPSEALPGDAHATDAPLWAAAIGALVVGAVSLEVRRGTMNGAMVAVLPAARHHRDGDLSGDHRRDRSLAAVPDARPVVDGRDRRPAR
jgi:hypothetical protein